MTKNEAKTVNCVDLCFWRSVAWTWAGNGELPDPRFWFLRVGSSS